MINICIIDWPLGWLVCSHVLRLWEHMCNSQCFPYSLCAFVHYPIQSHGLLFNSDQFYSEFSCLLFSHSLFLYLSFLSLSLSLYFSPPILSRFLCPMFFFLSFCPSLNDDDGVNNPPHHRRRRPTIWRRWQRQQRQRWWQRCQWSRWCHSRWNRRWLCRFVGISPLPAFWHFFTQASVGVWEASVGVWDAFADVLSEFSKFSNFYRLFKFSDFSDFQMFQIFRIFRFFKLFKRM